MQKDKLYHRVYADITAAVYLYCLENKLKVSIENINKSKQLSEWAESLTNTIMEMYAR